VSEGEFAEVGRNEGKACSRFAITLFGKKIGNRRMKGNAGYNLDI
jgi:hypothetical protein